MRCDAAVALPPPEPRPARDPALVHPLDGRPVRRRRDPRRGPRRAGPAARRPGAGRPSTSSARRSRSEAAAAAAADRYLELLDALAARGLDGNVSLKLSQMGLDLSPEVMPGERRPGSSRRPPQTRRLRPDRHGGPRPDRRDPGTVARAAPLEPGERRRDPGRPPAERRRHRGADRRAGRRSGCARAPIASRPTSPSRPKAEVDQSYLALLARLLREGTNPALATHDPRMIQAATDLVERDGIGARPVRVPDAVRRPARSPGAARRGRLPGPDLRPVRARVVSVLHAPAGRAAGQRRCSSCAASASEERRHRLSRRRRGDRAGN